MSAVPLALEATVIWLAASLLVALCVGAFIAVGMGR